ncbi:hypothetical protein D9M68_908580 [compost metagenome]
MGLSAQIVHLVRLHLLDNSSQVGGIAQVTVMQNEVSIVNVRVLVDVIHALSIEGGSTALDAVDFIALF